MDEELKKKIITDITKTGFPSELKVASILRQSQWTCEQNSTYSDFETDRSREIDLKARKYFNRKDEKFSCAINLVIEVKKSSRPWVFFTIPNSKNYFEFKGPGYGIIHSRKNITYTDLRGEDLMHDFPRNSTNIIGTNFYEAFKSPDEPSKIYEALMSSIKASFYEVYQANGLLSENKSIPTTNDSLIQKNESNHRHIEIYVPVVVIDGVLCISNLTEEQNIELEEALYVPVQMSHSAAPYDNYNLYHPEVISLKYISDFLKSMENWGDSLLYFLRKTSR
ncbi:MAG: hypothetical protein C0448_05215 [Sphingobacteriaceae bacterium]|nr:hypothetical protein [Sphingobacteriaceae bacterium]